MLKSASSMKGLTIKATDGEIGKVDQFLFDDENWAVRYLVVNTGNWLDERLLLISPIFIGQADWASERLEVRMTKEQVAKSPDIDTHRPVSRQHEAEFMDYYGYPQYWGDSGIWGSGMYPSVMVPMPVFVPPPVPSSENESADSHLWSTNDVTGYHVEATDGELGHVVDFIVDLEMWAIVYVEIGTRNWLPGKKVLLSPQWIKTVEWDDAKVYAALTREAIEDAPEYAESKDITREYETALHEHYGVPPYWSHGSRRPNDVAAGEGVEKIK